MKLLKIRKEDEENTIVHNGSFYDMSFNENQSEFVNPCEEPQKMQSLIKNPFNFKFIKIGIALKKCGWIFFRERELKLTNQMFISYYNPVSKEYKVN